MALSRDRWLMASSCLEVLAHVIQQAKRSTLAYGFHQALVDPGGFKRRKRNGWIACAVLCRSDKPTRILVRCRFLVSPLTFESYLRFADRRSRDDLAVHQLDGER
ncbi:mlr8097 [Mesorhizobium japonicum MAFF 303099]|uniref:Mlr8097 protein n=1 Tax=Mesorhizobium japonicum (strain LMG 29417 / CECT 9101 / MAFF 303099) TaxID=266835 RepID=Q983Z4_RHILO|nr:mlr8097 [Mesorhizobium japonicum MAFF 303099]